VGVSNDAAIAAGVRRWVEQLAHGTREDRETLIEWVEEADRSGFPAELAVSSLAQLPARTLWKTFDDTELQDLYDLASETGLDETAECFKAAVLARPYIDDGKVPQDIVDLVMARDGYRCQECGCTTDLTIDHKIVPWSEGGSSTDPDNLQVLCRSCNSRKGTRPWIPPAGASA
jgi:HNH endonuclease